MADNPSFDIVSEVDFQEMRNAAIQAEKEIADPLRPETGGRRSS